MNIEIMEGDISRIEKVLSCIPKGAERALSNAINRGLSKVKTSAKKGVTEVYTVQSSTFSSAANTNMKKASTSNLVGSVSFSGYKIPLFKFKVTPSLPRTKEQVRAAVTKGSSTPFMHAFIADMPHGLGVFERKTEQRFPVKELMGLSAAQMVSNQKVMEGLEEEAQKTVHQRMEHEIDRLLNGYSL